MSHEAKKHDVMPQDFFQRKVRIHFMNAGLISGSRLGLGVALAAWGPSVLVSQKLLRSCAVNRDWSRPKQMPTLRSSSKARQTARLAAEVKLTFNEIQEETVVADPVKQSQASADQPTKKSANRKRKRAVHQADDDKTSQAETLAVSAVSIAVEQPGQKPAAPAKKAKARKALLATLWTEADLVPLRAKAEQLFDQLNELYIDPPCPLNYESPFQLLVAVILSAQVPHCTYQQA